jgi:hypothetical protein
VSRMSTRTHGMRTRIACVASAIALVALIGGCAQTASTEPSSGVGVAVAPLPETATTAYDSRTGASTDSLQYSTGAPASDGGKGSATTVSTVTKLVVVNKTLRIETADVDASIAKIRELAARDKGDITNMQVSSATDQPVYPLAYEGVTSSGSRSASSVPLKAYVTVRVPSTTYAAFIADAAKLGRVLYQSETADDVTQQHVDMKARIDNLKAELLRLRQLFAKATRVSDMLAIEQEVTRVQGEIESMQAQISYLERQAAMATVTIELAEPEAVVSPAGTDWGVRSAFTAAVRAFVNTLNVIIVLLGPVLAMALFVGLPVLLIVWLARRSIRRRRTAKAAVEAAAAPAVPAAPMPGNGGATA